MPSYTWMPAPLKRILEPFLKDRSPAVRDHVDRAMERISLDPYHPPFPIFPWKGLDWDAVPNAFVVNIGEDLLIRYQIMRDFPVIGLVNIIDLNEIPGPNDEETIDLSGEPPQS